MYQYTFDVGLDFETEIFLDLQLFTSSYLTASISILSIVEPRRARVSTIVENTTSSIFIDLLIKKKWNLVKCDHPLKREKFSINTVE